MRDPIAPNPKTATRLIWQSWRLRWLFRRGLTVTEVPVEGDLVISSVLVLRSAALAGLGPALLPDWMIADDLAKGRLVDLFPGYDVAATTFDTAAWLLCPSRKQLPRKVRLTIDFLRERLDPAVRQRLRYLSPP